MLVLLPARLRYGFLRSSLKAVAIFSGLLFRVVMVSYVPLAGTDKHHPLQDLKMASWLDQDFIETKY